MDVLVFSGVTSLIALFCRVAGKAVGMGGEAKYSNCMGITSLSQGASCPSQRRAIRGAPRTSATSSSPAPATQQMVKEQFWMHG